MMSRTDEVALSTGGARRGWAGSGAAGGEEALSGEGLVVAGSVGDPVMAAPQAIEARVSRRAESCRGVILLTVRA